MMGDGSGYISNYISSSLQEETREESVLNSPGYDAEKEKGKSHK